MFVGCCIKMLLVVCGHSDIEILQNPVLYFGCICIAKLGDRLIVRR